MTSTCSRAILVVASSLLSLFAATAGAEVHVSIGLEPIELSSGRPTQPTDLPDTFGRTAETEGDRSLVGSFENTWYINYYEADLSQTADATLWAVRNESELPVDVFVQYFPLDSFLTPDQVEMFTVPVHGVQTRNTRDVPGLPGDSEGFARGHIRIEASGSISVDFFQLIASEDFATADVAGTIEEVCNELSFRFIDFGGDRGSVATFLVGSPQGADPLDDPTLAGNVYDEDGSFINSFVVRTDQVSYRLDVRSFVLPGTLFGSIEIDASDGGGTITTVSHSADGRFSVSNAVFCRDPSGPVMI